MIGRGIILEQSTHTVVQTCNPKMVFLSCNYKTIPGPSSESILSIYVFTVNIKFNTDVGGLSLELLESPLPLLNSSALATVVHFTNNTLCI